MSAIYSQALKLMRIDQSMWQNVNIWVLQSMSTQVSSDRFCFVLKSLTMLFISGWPGIHCIVEASFKVMAILLFPKFRNYSLPLQGQITYFCKCHLNLIFFPQTQIRKSCDSQGSVKYIGTESCLETPNFLSQVMYPLHWYLPLTLRIELILYTTSDKQYANPSPFDFPSSTVFFRAQFHISTFLLINIQQTPL